MEFRTHSFRYGLEILTTQKEFKVLWDEVTDAINSISDEDIIHYFENQKITKKAGKTGKKRQKRVANASKFW